MGGHQHVALQHVAVFVHLGQLQTGGQGGQRAVAVGDEADDLRPGAQPAQTADDAQRGSGAAAGLAVAALDENLNGIGGPLFAGDGLNAHLVGAVGQHDFLDRLAAGAGSVQKLKKIHDLL